MRKLVDWIQAAALALGAPGLFLAAVADSSFISLPEVVDILLIWMVTQHKSRMLLYASSATLGSVVGCLLLYAITPGHSSWPTRLGWKSRLANA